eukprot:97058-Prorocentrum_minimum.AAC.1
MTTVRNKHKAILLTLLSFRDGSPGCCVHPRRYLHRRTHPDALPGQECGLVFGNSVRVHRGDVHAGHRRQHVDPRHLLYLHLHHDDGRHRLGGDGAASEGGELIDGNKKSNNKHLAKDLVMCCAKRERLGVGSPLILTEKHQHVADMHTMS